MHIDYSDYNLNIFQLIVLINIAIDRSHRQRISEITGTMVVVVDQFEFVVQSIPEEALREQLFSSFVKVMESMEKQDYLLLTDYLELGIKEPLCRYMERAHSEDEIIFKKSEYEQFMSRVLFEEKDEYLRAKPPLALQELEEMGYKLERTSTGAYTLRRTVHGKTFYMYTNYDPLNASYQLAVEWASEKKERYIVLGMGLFYTITQLASNSIGAFVEVYESDINIINLAAGYTVTSKFFKSVFGKNIKIVYDPMYTKFFRELKNMDAEHTKACFYYPSILAIEDTSLRENIMTYFTQMDNINRWKDHMLHNFKYNTTHTSHKVDELRDEFQGKNLYIVAAGPSLDKNFAYLKDVNKDTSIILCVGTVFRKLLQAQIPIDYVMVTDPKSQNYCQFDGLMDEQIPLIGLSTMNKKIFEQYSGKKYIMYQNGYEQAEQEAKNKHSMLVNTGGSVSTTAIDLGIQMKCKRIICVGMDLAHTGNKLHASLPSNVNESENQAGSILIDGYYGDKVSTSKTFDAFRKWIENRIAKVTEVEIYNATEGGAYIKGMTNISLAKIVKDLILIPD